ncbi:hypothetical protein K502DRAFT_322840 [Neoconidiobolus thromboides FSU 785]|nr:hypothetical protein K502DRAFT_322840 [Neoconidiobolus thromboides FSU 785]
MLLKPKSVPPIRLSIINRIIKPIKYPLLYINSSFTTTHISSSYVQLTTDFFKSVTESSIEYDNSRLRRQARSRSNNQLKVQQDTNEEWQNLRLQKRIKKLKSILKSHQIIELEQVWESYLDIKEVSVESLKGLESKIFERMIYLYQCCELKENYYNIKIITEDMIKLNYNIDKKQIQGYLRACLELKEYHNIIKFTQYLVRKQYTLDTFILNHLFSAYVQLNDIESSLMTLDHFKTENVLKDQYTLSTEVLLNFKRNEPQLALSTYTSIFSTNIKIDTWTLNMFLQIFSQYRYWQGIQQVLIDMKQKNVIPDLHTFSILLKCCILPFNDNCIISYKKKPYLRQQIEIVNKIYFNLKASSFPLDKYIYCNFIKFYVTIQEFCFAENILLDMKQKGIQPNEFEYSILMDGYSKVKQWDKLWKIYQIIKQENISINQIIYSCMVKAYTKLNENRIKEEGGRAIMEDDIFKKDQITYNLFLRQLGKLGKVKEGFELYIEMKNENIQPNLMTYYHLLDGLKRNNEIEDNNIKEKEKEKKKIIEIIFNDLITSNLVPNLSIFNHFIYLFNQYQLINYINITYTLMIEKYQLLPNQYSLLPMASILLNGCNINEVVNNIISSKYPQLIYSSSIYALIKNGELQKGIELFEYIKKGGVIGVKNDLLIYYYLLYACIQYKEFYYLMKLMQQIDKENIIITKTMYLKLNNKLNAINCDKQIMRLWNRFEYKEKEAEEDKMEKMMEIDFNNNKIQSHLIIPLLKDCYLRMLNH